MVSLLIGCGSSGPAYWPVSGKVTFRGKPVTVAKIRFCSTAAGLDVVMPLEADGQYNIVTGDHQGLREGQYQLAITPKLDFSKAKRDENGVFIPSTMPSETERFPPNIPRKYHDPVTSGLTLTVKPESNTFDVDMQ
jgi:hypothetical protein